MTKSLILGDDETLVRCSCGPSFYRLSRIKEDGQCPKCGAQDDFEEFHRPEGFGGSIYPVQPVGNWRGLRAADMEFDAFELNVLRQWFDAVKDINPEYLESQDAKVVIRINDALRLRTPDDVRELAASD